MWKRLKDKTEKRTSYQNESYSIKDLLLISITLLNITSYSSLLLIKMYEWKNEV